MITFSLHGQALSRAASANLSRTFPPRFDICMQDSTAPPGNGSMTGKAAIEFSTRTGRAILLGVLKAPIIAYRILLSPFLPRVCRFHPSCSSYALQALQVHGPFKGSYLALRRLLRCHPFTALGGGSGCDPVPPASR